MKKITKSFLTMLLAVLLVAALVPAVALAAEEVTYVAQVGETSYETLQEAVDAAKVGGTITLLSDVTLTDVVKLEKKVKIDGAGYTVTSSAPVAFEVCNRTTDFLNVTIVNTAVDGRCIDINVDKIYLTVKNSTLTATNGKTQVLTISGTSDMDKAVWVKNSVIDAGADGYGIVANIASDITIHNNSVVSGYATVSMAEGSAGSSVTVGIDTELNGMMEFNDDDISVNIQNGATVAANANGTALNLNGHAVSVAINDARSSLVADNENSSLLEGFDPASGAALKVTGTDMAEALEAEGYVLDENMGILGLAEAKVDGKNYLTLEEAAEYTRESYPKNVIYLLRDVTIEDTVKLTGWSDVIQSIEGEKYTITYTGSDAAIELAGMDSKISQVIIDVAGAEEGTAAIKITNGTTGHPHGLGDGGEIKAGENVAFKFTGDVAYDVQVKNSTIDAATLVENSAENTQLTFFNNTVNEDAVIDVASGQLKLIGLWGKLPLTIGKLVVGEGATLDLYEAVLTVAEVEIAENANIIDTKDGVGKIVIESGALDFQGGDNEGYLPIYDVDAGSYSFYKVTLVNKGVKFGTNNAKFGFAIQFTNPDAYAAMAKALETNPDFTVSFAWIEATDDVTGDGEKEFSDAMLQNYAEIAYERAENEGTLPALTVTLNGVEAGDEVSAIARIASAGAVITGEEITEVAPEA